MFQDFKIAYMRKHVKVKEKRRLSFLRQSIAYVLSQAAGKTPHAAANIEFDVTPLIEYTRGSASNNKNGAECKPENALLHRAIRKNYSAFFIKAIAHSIYHTPCINGFLDYTPLRNGGTFYLAEDINLSFTVNTKFGVIKPIIRNPHLKPLVKVANEMRLLSRKARRTDAEELYTRTAKEYLKFAVRQLDFASLGALWRLVRSLLWQRHQPDPAFINIPEEKKLQITDILGATCTVANIGMSLEGHQTVTVIIPPEVTMFGIGNVSLMPRVVNGEIVPRYVVTVCATMDHRAYDAGEAFPFITHLSRYIENPGLIYEWKAGDEV